MTIKNIQDAYNAMGRALADLDEEILENSEDMERLEEHARSFNRDMNWREQEGCDSLREIIEALEEKSSALEEAMRILKEYWEVKE